MNKIYILIKNLGPELEFLMKMLMNFGQTFMNVRPNLFKVLMILPSYIRVNEYL